MILLCPYQVDTLYRRNPWGNLGLIVVTVLISLLLFYGRLPEAVVPYMVLIDWSPAGLLGYQFLHAGWLHLLGNMIFLFVFGNAVCGVMNSFFYVGLYLGLGVFAGAIHLLCDGRPAIGASGAISGIVGLYLAVYPTNTIRCFWLFLIRGGVAEFSGWVPILAWFGLDLFGAVHGSGNTAYFAHVGGTVGGFLLGLLLLRFGLIDLFEYDHPTVLQLFARRPKAN